MAHRQSGYKAQKHSYHWLGVLAFVVLFLVGGSWLLLSRLEGVAVESVRGTAMTPLISEGDGVVVAKTNLIAAGDVISYRSPVNPNEVLTRRVSAVNAAQDVVITKGDSSAKLDSPFSRSLVIGVVHYRVVKLGYVVDFLRSPAGLIAGIYLPAAVIVGMELRRLAGHYERDTYRLLGYPLRTIDR